MTDAHLKIEDEGEDEKEDDFPPSRQGGRGFKACKRAKPMFTGVLCDFKAYRGIRVVRFARERGERRREKGKSRNGKRRRAGTVAPYPLKQIMNYAAGRSSIMVVGFIVTTSDHRLPPGTTADIR